jgi:hypothetical protein
MRLYNVYGKLVNKNVFKYYINWDKKSLSKPQWETKQFLKPYWKNHMVYEEFPVYGSLLKVDIFNATLNVAIEINGPQHYEFHHFHGKSPAKYILAIKNDVKKEEWLRLNKITLIELKDSEVKLLSKDFFREKFNFYL